MASTKKEVFGPLTANTDHEPAVQFKLPNTVNAAGETVDGEKYLLLLSELSPEIVTRLAVHGLSQKVGDSFAGAADEPDPVAYAIARIKDTWEQLKRGEWRVTGTGGPRATLLGRALARVSGHTIEEAMAVLQDKEDSLSEEEFKAFLKALRADPSIKQAQADIKLEDAQKAKERASGASGTKADLGALFG